MDAEYVFFDLDGTLTDSQPGIYDSLRIMLGHFGITKTDEELKPFLGPALWDSLPMYCGFTHEQCKEAVKVFREHYFSKGIYNNRVYDGIVPLLEELKAAGKKLVIATGKPTEQAEIVVNHFDLAKYFDFIAGSSLDTSRSKKSQVIAYALQNLNFGENDKRRILMVGDRKNDIDGAHENGLKVAAVLYGYGSRPEFEKAGADYIVDSVAELKKFLLVHKV
ncbi:MAG: HAD-IA family hydrolase [Treponema sp.]|nr:HAD-IA family hydrolase [Treponema sp.]